MWQEKERKRFQELRQSQDERELTNAEQAEFARLHAELDALEAAYLAPASQRIRQEREAIEGQNQILEQLAHRKESLIHRLRAFLMQAQAERSAIDDELAAVLTASQGSETDK